MPPQRTPHLLPRPTKHEESIQNIGALIQSMFESDNAKANAALDALKQGLREDKKEMRQGPVALP
jgi:hypothetical protein